MDGSNIICKISLQEQGDIFSYRFEINPLKLNFKGDKIIEYCVCQQIMENKPLHSGFSSTVNGH